MNETKVALSPLGAIQSTTEPHVHPNTSIVVLNERRSVAPWKASSRSYHVPTVTESTLLPVVKSQSRPSWTRVLDVWTWRI
jgi:hypothetical protein